MEKISLMTMSMFMRPFIIFNVDHDLENLTDNYEEILDMSRDAGFTAVDVTSWEIDLLGLSHVKETLARHGLSVSSLIWFGEYGQVDPEGFDQRVARGKQGVDTALALGTDIFMAVPQAQKDIEKYKPQEIHQAMARHWQPITAYAREKNIHVVVEDTPDLRLHFCKAEDVKAVLDMVPGLELVYDSANMILVGEDPLAYVKMFAGRIGYVHLKDYRPAPAGSRFGEVAQNGTKMSTAPTGTGVIDLKAVAASLREAGYEGRMSVEFAVDDDQDFIKSLARSHAYAMALWQNGEF